MSMITDMILEQYDENLPIYNKISDIVKSTLEKIAEELGIECSVICSRIKARDSLQGKLDRKAGKYKNIYDLTDIVGSRVVTFYQSDVDKIAAKVVSTFNIDWDNSIDKRKVYNIDQFGYISLHYIVQIPKEIYFDPDHPEINTIRSEIQLRTNLQHTWASIYHESGYKSDIEIPKDTLRQFSRLAGLLELVDQEFQRMHDSLGEYRRRITSVVKSGKFEEAELNGDSFKVYVQSGAFDSINERIASINSMEIEPVSLMPFLKVFKVLEFETLKDVDNLVKECYEAAYQLTVLQFSGTDLDIITSAAGPFALCCVFIMKNGFGEGSIKNLLDIIFGERKNNTKNAAMFYKYGITLGLIKEHKDE